MNNVLFSYSMQDAYSVGSNIFGDVIITVRCIFLKILIVVHGIASVVQIIKEY